MVANAVVANLLFAAEDDAIEVTEEKVGQLTDEHITVPFKLDLTDDRDAPLIDVMTPSDGKTIKVGKTDVEVSPEDRDEV